MKRILFAPLALLLCAALAACCGIRDDAGNRGGDTPAAAPQVVQAGRFDAFAAGDFKGHVELTRLSKGAWIGLGTFEGVDGELIILDGVIYKASSDGKVSVQSATLKTPFAMAAKGGDLKGFAVKTGLTPNALTELIDAEFPEKDEFLAIRIEGSFKKLKLRSPPPAKEPYPDLGAVVAKQKVFDLENVEGILLGFRTPPSCAGLNVPGYHFHFLAKNHKAGGHVLDFLSGSACSGEAMSSDNLDLILTPAFSKTAKGPGASFAGESVGH
jgi:acetolactate decarboxylase